MDVGGLRLGVDDELVPLELRVDVATLLCAAQQLELEALIGGVLEPGTGLDRAVMDDRAQCRVVLTLPGDRDVDDVEPHRFARHDEQADDPVLVVTRGAAADGGRVVAVRPQRIGRLVDRAIREPAHLRIGEVVALHVPA